MSTTSPTRIMVITCSSRQGAIGPAIADWFVRTVAPLASHLGAHLESLSLSELALPFLDEEEHPSTGIYHRAHTRRWSAMADAADGFIVVTPEYNYGMPASLKNALDYLSSEWAWKPMGFVSYGNTSAGTRSVQHTKQVATTLRLVPLGATVALRLRDAVEDGTVVSLPHQDAAAEDVLRETVRASRALRPLRDALKTDSAAGPVPGSYTQTLTPDDAGQVTVLQRCCWVDEAIDNDSLALAPLKESVNDVARWLSEWTTTGLWLDGRLIAMVRVRRSGRTGEIGRLAVAPDQRGAGIGRWLLRHAEAALAADCDRFELSTGARSSRNIAMYQSGGFRIDTKTEGVIRLSKTFSDGVATARGR